MSRGRSLLVTIDVTDWSEKGDRTPDEIAEAIFEHLHATADDHAMCPLDDCFADLSFDSADGEVTR